MTQDKTFFVNLHTGVVRRSVGFVLLCVHFQLMWPIEYKIFPTKIQKSIKSDRGYNPLISLIYWKWLQVHCTIFIPKNVSLKPSAREFRLRQTKMNSSSTSQHENIAKRQNKKM